MTKPRHLFPTNIEKKSYNENSDRLFNSEEVTITLTVEELGLIAHVLSVKEVTEEFNEAIERVAEESGKPAVLLRIKNVLERTADERKALHDRLNFVYNDESKKLRTRLGYWLMGRRYRYSHDPRKRSNPKYKQYLDWFWEDPCNRGWEKEL
tara:strand:- start:6 stop:461 length:456 start_codon:yes stop_codon:yes gene_type:complete